MGVSSALTAIRATVGTTGGTTVGTTVGAAATVAATGPVHGAVGIVCAFESQASGYVQPETVVTDPDVSAASAQPSPSDTLFVGAGVNVAGGSVYGLTVLV